MPASGEVFTSETVVPASTIACREINANSTVLSDYELVIEWSDTRVRDVKVLDLVNPHLDLVHVHVYPRLDVVNLQLNLVNWNLDLVNQCSYLRNRGADLLNRSAVLLNHDACMYIYYKGQRIQLV